MTRKEPASTTPEEAMTSSPDPQWTDPLFEEDLTLDEAADAFEAERDGRNGRRYLRVALQYYRDEMIGEEEIASIRAQVAECAA